MKRFCFLFILSGIITYTHAQVGINTVSPLTSFHVEAEKTDATTPEGIIAPKLTRAQLIAKTSNAQYTTAHKGVFVYVTTLDGITTTQTANVTTIGYYYFDGTIWKHFNDKLQTADNGLSVGTTANVQLGGDLNKNTEINTQGNNLSITGTGNMGIGTTSPSTKLHINSGGTSATPVTGFKLEDGNQSLGRVLTSDTNGNGTWLEPGTTSAIIGSIPAAYTTQATYIPSSSGYIGYTGMNITLPPGSFQINFSIWIEPTGTNTGLDTSPRFCSIFLSDSSTSITNTNFTYSGGSNAIRSIIIPRLYASLRLDFYGSGAIPVTVTSTTPTTIFIWTYLSQVNYSSVSSNNMITSKNSSHGSYGPYTQLYMLYHSI